VPADLRLGIDVGGTNTDAVVVDRDDALLAKAKVPTTPDVTTGIAASIEAVLARLGEGRDRITHAMLGTTHATNALLARTGLRRVAVLRIGGPATRAVPPLATFPPDLRAAVAAGTAVVDGGIEFDGTEVAPFDSDAAARFFASVRGRADAVAITSVFSAVSDRHELAAEAVARAVLGDVHVSLSHEVGSIGLIERENATVLNAALVGVAETVARSFGEALARQGLRPAEYFAQNDGTLMELEYALRYPVLTIGCGTPWWPTSAARPPRSGCCSTVSPASRATRPGSAASGRTSGCRGWSRCHWAAGPSWRAGSVRSVSGRRAWATGSRSRRWCSGVPRRR
jgi:N-methylhydantoinase A/oxoprolinase/acetone carboxylase beta subunit